MKRTREKIIAIGITFIIIYTNFIALQASCHVARRIVATKPLYVCYNLLLLAAVYCVIEVFSPRLYVSSMVFSTVCLIWAIVNDYVYALHGQIFTLAELKNIRTAWNVLGEFSLVKRIPLIFGGVILIIYAFNMVMCYIQKKMESRLLDVQRKMAYKAVLVVIAIGMFVLLYFPAYKLQDIIWRTWSPARDTVIEEGYPLYLYSNIFFGAVKIAQPEGYNEELILDYGEYADSGGQGVRPDIILIMNESFYDLALLTELDVDIPYMENFYSMKNAIRGYAVTSVTGGATNRSEFELLTSNTNYLLGELTPFNFLDMSCTSSVVTNLKECGYYTLAAHPEDGENYNRVASYSAMGFDQKYFKEDFTDYEYYGNRAWMTDKGAYNNLITWYEAAKAENENVFVYLLTMQNHGGYSENSEDEAIVYVQNYDGNMEKELNEYLSCVYLSDRAFKELTEYYSEMEQPVIICMVGDHAPGMVRELVDVDFSMEQQILARATPFIIWANYEIDSRDMGIINVNGLVPLLLEEAGVEMIPYYRYIREMQEKVPVLGSSGYIMNADRDIYSYYDDTEYSDMVWKYIYLSYNNLQEESINGWFHLEN